MMGIALGLAVVTAWAHPHRGETSVVLVMEQARSPACAVQLHTLARAELGAPVAGVTHDPPAAAALVTHATGVRTYSHPEGIRGLGLWRPEVELAKPAVVVFDRCGTEVGRVVGREPGVDVTPEVRKLVTAAEEVTRCGRPAT